MENSDCVSLHCTLESSTRHMINNFSIKAMKPSAFLVNTASGGLVDQSADVFIRATVCTIMDLKNTILNDVLCFVSTARHILKPDEIIDNCSNFYSAVVLFEAKEILFNLCGEHATKRLTKAFYLFSLFINEKIYTYY